MREIYTQFAQSELDKHPEWWGKYEQKVKLKNCYIYAKERDHVVLKMSWYSFKEIVESYFHKAKAAIIQGETLRIGASVGKIRAIRVERNFSNPVIDWVKTYTNKEFDEKGHLIKRYYTDEDWCRIEWEKFGVLSNESIYNFYPATRNMATNKGFKAEFVQALRKDPLLKFKYKFYPYVKVERKQTKDELQPL